MKKTTPKKNEAQTEQKSNGRLDERSLQEKIAERAYELYQKRGQYHGSDLDDWLEAERSILSEHNATMTEATPAPKPKPAASAKGSKKRSSEQKAAS